MTKIVLVLLYLYNGQLKLLQTPTASMDDCMAKAEVRMGELNRDPKFDEGLFGACMELEVTEAKNGKN